MLNYPDDMGCYNNDPRSPEYAGSEDVKLKGEAYLVCKSCDYNCQIIVQVDGEDPEETERKIDAIPCIMSKEADYQEWEFLVIRTTGADVEFKGLSAISTYVDIPIIFEGIENGDIFGI